MKNMFRLHLLAAAAALAVSASADGIPEPSIVQYGDVRFSGGTLWTGLGTVKIELTPAAGGETLVFTAPIQPIPAGGAVYSYAAKLPLETLLAGMTATPGTIPNAPATYTRRTTVTVGTEEEVIDDSVTFSAGELRGATRRLDVVLGGTEPGLTPTPTASPTPTPLPTGTPIPTATPFPPGCCPGDANGDEIVNTDDYAAARDAFGTAGTAGDANCDGFVNASDFATTLEFFGASCLARPGGGDDLAAEPEIVLRAGSAAKARLFLSPATANVTPGQTFTLEVRLDANGFDPAVAGAFLTYDSAALTFVPAGAGSETGANRTLFENAFLTADPAEREPGVISFPAGAFEPVEGLDQLVARVSFVASASAGSTTVAFSTDAQRATSVRRLDLAAVPAQLDGATVNIAAVRPPRLFVSPATRFVSGSGDYTVEVRLDGNDRPASSAVVFVQYDPLVAEFVSGEVDGTLFDDTTVTTQPSLVAPGILAFNAGSTGTVTANDQRVATLTFRPLADGSFPVTILRTVQRPSRVLDASFADLSATISSGFVTQEDYVAPTPTPSPTPSATPSETPTASPTETATPTVTPTATDTPTATVTPTATEEPTPSATEAPTATPTDAVTATPTDVATATPTDSATATPTEAVTATPTDAVTATPTDAATTTPTDVATATPTDTATATPTDASTATPTDAATATPTDGPTATATETATASPTEAPTASVTATPGATQAPTATASATPEPTVSPTASASPTLTPVPTPSATPVLPPLQSIIESLLRRVTSAEDVNQDGVSDVGDIVTRQNI